MYMPCGPTIGEETRPRSDLAQRSIEPAGRYVFSVRSRLGGMGKYTCPWAVASHRHGQVYLPMPPNSRRPGIVGHAKHVPGRPAGTVGLARADCCRKVPRGCGFTLVELLTVIAIVALLMALLLPSLKGVRDQSRAVLCLSNLRQMTIAAGVYIELNNGRYPVAYWNDSSRPGVWINTNWDYEVVVDWNAGGTKTISTGLLWSGAVASKIQQCPVFKGSSNTIMAEPHTGYNYNTSYIGHGQGESEQSSAMAGHVARPPKCALFGDGQWKLGANKFMRAPWPNPGDASFFGRYAGTQGFRHRGMTNVAFCDGHAESWQQLHTETSPAEQEQITKGTGFLSADNSMYDLE